MQDHVDYGLKLSIDLKNGGSLVGINQQLKAEGFRITRIVNKRRVKNSTWRIQYTVAILPLEVK